MDPFNGCFIQLIEVTVLHVNEQNEKPINLIADGHRALGDGL